MSVQSLLTEPGRVDEPRVVEEYSDVLTQVAADGKPVIVRRNGGTTTPIIPLIRMRSRNRDGTPPPAAWQRDLGGTGRRERIRQDPSGGRCDADGRDSRSGQRANPCHHDPSSRPTARRPCAAAV